MAKLMLALALSVPAVVLSHSSVARSDGDGPTTDVPRYSLAVNERTGLVLTMKLEIVSRTPSGTDDERDDVPSSKTNATTVRRVLWRADDGSRMVTAVELESYAAHYWNGDDWETMGGLDLGGASMVIHEADGVVTHVLFESDKTAEHGRVFALGWDPLGLWMCPRDALEVDETIETEAVTDWNYFPRNRYETIMPEVQANDALAEWETFGQFTLTGVNTSEDGAETAEAEWSATAVAENDDQSDSQLMQMFGSVTFDLASEVPVRSEIRFNSSYASSGEAIGSGEYTLDYRHAWMSPDEIEAYAKTCGVDLAAIAERAPEPPTDDADEADEDNEDDEDDEDDRPSDGNDRGSTDE